MLLQATDVLPARPDLARRFRDRRWLDDVRADLAAAGRQANWTRHREHIAELIAAHSDRWLRSRPSMAVLERLSGLSRRTVQDACRWLERGGWLAVMEHGTTPRYAPDRLAAGDANLAREWLLTTPAPDENCAPTHTPTASRPSAGAREAAPVANTGPGDTDRRSAPGSSSLAPPRWRAQAPAWPLGKTPQRRGEMLTAAETLQRDHMVLRRLSARRLRSILRPWFGALWPPAGGGWTPLSVLYAIEHDQDGRPHEYAGRVRDPASWLEHRLSFWLDADGRPLPPHSARLAERAAGHRAGLARERAEREAAETARLAPAGDYATQAGADAARGAGRARELGLAGNGGFAAALRRRARLRRA